MTSRPADDLVEVRTERIATGGESVGRLDDGRVIFVRGALPGELVAVEIVENKKRFARGIAREVRDAAPERSTPGCAHASSGACGGCDWMMVEAHAQHRFKAAIVVEQLQRLGGVDQPVVASVDSPRGARTTVRCGVVDGRAGYRSRRSDTVFDATECRAAHPLLEELIVGASFGDATEVTLRAGASTGERLVLTNGDPQLVVVPDDVVVATTNDPGRAAIHEVVAGRRWRVSAGSFFQTSHDGAEALVAAVVRGMAGATGPVVDLYAGVGLLGGGAVAEQLELAVESSASSVADARHNLGADVRVEQCRVERWAVESFPNVIADPARRGLGKSAVAVIDETEARRLVLVSCDPASLGRDTALLGDRGFAHESSDVIDMFPDTSRIEVVSTFSR